MKKFEIDCWEITTPDYGGQREEHVCYLATKEQADKYVELNNKRNPDGQSNWPVSSRRFKSTYTIWDSIEEMENNSRKKIKQKALEKIAKILTKEETEVLGIEFE